MEPPSSGETDKLLNDLLSPDYPTRRQAIEKLGELPASSIQIVGALVAAREGDENLMIRKLAGTALQMPAHKAALEQCEKEALIQEVARRIQARRRQTGSAMQDGLDHASGEAAGRDVANTTGEKLGAWPYVVGGLSFIPLCGVVFGIVSIVWGLVTPKRGGKLLALIGASGIAFTVIIYGTLFYFGFIQRGGVYDSLREELARSQLASLVPSIEFYKVQNGRYPDSLVVLQKSLRQGQAVFIVDPTSMVGLNPQTRLFYYEVVNDGSGYYLLGVGTDGKPFTSDDLAPSVNANNAGLQISPDSRP